MFTKQARQFDQWADDNDKLKAIKVKKAAEKDDELSDRDKAMIDDYEEEEANREVPRDYASMYERFQKIAGLDS